MQILFRDTHTGTYLQRLFLSCGNKTSDLEPSEIRLLLLIEKSTGRENQKEYHRPEAERSLNLNSQNKQFNRVCFIYRSTMQESSQLCILPEDALGNPQREALSTQVNSLIVYIWERVQVYLSERA